MREMMMDAVAAAMAGGAEYADVRWGDTRRQTISARGSVVNGIRDSRSSGYGVRVYRSGAWGFASGTAGDLDMLIGLVERALEIAEASAAVRDEPLRLTPLDMHVGEWSTPVRRDPFSVPLREKTDLLLQINAELEKEAAVREGISYMFFSRMHKRYANSVGSFTNQLLHWSMVEYSAHAVGNGRFETRSFQSSPRAMGYELVESLPLLQESSRVASEAARKLHAARFDRAATDLILLPSHTRLVIHETIGHATELDRVMGWEADYAGTSFATPEKLQRYRYGSPVFTVTADRTQPHGMATCAFDDDGVPAQSWPLIREGILVDYATTRDTAPLAGFTSSRGCAVADHWSSFPILRMPNVGIDPGPEDAPSLEALIADTRDGILFDGMDSFSIDQQRINFQFGGDLCRRIRNGRVEEILQSVTYESRNPDFWNSVDVICHPGEWRPEGITGCAKGQPVQSTALTHGSAPMRLRNVTAWSNG